MSFVAKAVKKVFKKVGKFVKKVVKSKWFKIAAIAALCVFTAGIGAAGGFAAFSTAATGGTLSGFMSAIGTTMSTGWTSILGTVGLAGTAAPTALASGAATVGTTANTVGVLAAGAGAAAPLGGTAGLLAGGATAATTAAGAAAGLGTAAATTAGWSVATAGVGVGQAATTSFLGKVGSMFMDPGLGGTMLRGGVMAAYQQHAANKQYERERYYKDNVTVAGGAAFGGSESFGENVMMPYLNREDKTEAGKMAQDAAFAPIDSTSDNKSRYLLSSSQQPQQPAGASPSGMLAQADQAGRSPTQDPAAQPQQGQRNKFLLDNFGADEYA